MTSSFNVKDASAYEQLMGRWSKKLAPLLVDFAGLAEGERIIDVGCGNGSLTFALARAPELRITVTRPNHGDAPAIPYSRPST
jgi:2-polyprenyl-3-methyl-5-hydroxy-6-metoxy-1,4-benzoquinol methylase